MPFPQNIPINITPENERAILDSVESDYENDLAHVMEDSHTEFVVEDNEDKYQDQHEEYNLLDSPNYNQPHAIVNESNSADEIHWKKFTTYIKIQNDCKMNDEVFIETDPLDNPLNVFEKLINFDDFLQHLKL